MRSSVTELARNRWPGILAALGVDKKLLNGKQQPCPFCPDGGTDRFRFTDHNGYGQYYCNKCGSGDGVRFLEEYHGWDFKTAAAQVKQYLAVDPIPAAPEKPKQELPRQELNDMWSSAAIVQPCDPVGLYLERRGLVNGIGYPTLRTHPHLKHFENDTLQYFPAMLGLIQRADGSATGIHRTYLTHDGNKAPVESVRKVRGIPAGGCVRLGPDCEYIALCEGLETGLALRAMDNQRTVWAALNAGNLERVDLPDFIEAVDICGDNDKPNNPVGQEAAYHLARRLRKDRRIAVRVFIPSRIGSDWLDAFNLKRTQ